MTDIIKGFYWFKLIRVSPKLSLFPTFPLMYHMWWRLSWTHSHMLRITQFCISLLKPSMTSANFSDNSLVKVFNSSLAELCCWHSFSVTPPIWGGVIWELMGKLDFLPHMGGNGKIGFYVMELHIMTIFTEAQCSCYASNIWIKNFYVKYAKLGDCKQRYSL